MEKFRNNLPASFLVFLAAAAAFVWYAVVYAEAGRDFAVTFFDVGQGDAIFIETENRQQILIDGGPNDRVLAKLGRLMPFWDRSLDLVILTHPHADHLDGLVEALKRYDVKMVLETGVRHSIPEYGEWREFLEKKKVNVVIAKAGQRVRFSETAHLDILAPFENFAGESPKNIHDAMIVAKLTNGALTVLLMGDAEKPIEHKLLLSDADIDSDILKVGHHGSKTSTSQEFLDAVSPSLAVISAGRKNRYGHPYQDVLARLAGAGIRVRRTDRDGDVRLLSDGLKYGIE